MEMTLGPRKDDAQRTDRGRGWNGVEWEYGGYGGRGRRGSSAGPAPFVFAALSHVCVPSRCREPQAQRPWALGHSSTPALQRSSTPAAHSSSGRLRATPSRAAPESAGERSRAQQPANGRRPARSAHAAHSNAACSTMIAPASARKPSLLRAGSIGRSHALAVARLLSAVARLRRSCPGAGACVRAHEHRVSTCICVASPAASSPTAPDELAVGRGSHSAGGREAKHEERVLCRMGWSRFETAAALSVQARTPSLTPEILAARRAWSARKGFVSVHRANRPWCAVLCYVVRRGPPTGTASEDGRCVRLGRVDTIHGDRHSTCTTPRICTVSERACIYH